MDQRTVSNEWNLIEDLPNDWAILARPDLDTTLERWDKEKRSLRDTGKVQQLQEHLATRWAIETGIIERLYTIDRGMTETLVAGGLEAIQRFSTTGSISHQAARLIEDQRAALDFVFSFLKEERSLSNSYIKELHQLLTKDQLYTEAVNQFGTCFETELLRGDWKKLPNNPVTEDGSIHEYCPPDFVQDEMDALISMHAQHLAEKVPPEVEAAWLHHRFTQIHPFQDGNGRVARALATMI
ncbi:MAG: Fic family protein, partial [Dehalococcoidia bacterium]